MAIEDWTIRVDKEKTTEQLRTELAQLAAAAVRSGAAYARDTWRVILTAEELERRGAALPSTSRAAMLAALPAIEMCIIAKACLEKLAMSALNGIELMSARMKRKTELDEAHRDASSEWWDEHCPCEFHAVARAGGVQA